MVSSKTLATINVSLAIIAVFLVLLFFEVKFVSLGHTLYQLDNNEEVCISTFDGLRSEIHVDLCCPELQVQLRKGEKFNQDLEVDGERFRVNKRYYTSENTIGYFVNMKAYRYCKINGFLV